VKLEAPSGSFLVENLDRHGAKSCAPQGCPRGLERTPCLLQGGLDWWLQLWIQVFIDDKFISFTQGITFLTSFILENNNWETINGKIVIV